MGSFNATCIISGLPIESGTPVRYIALTESAYQRGNESICYVQGRWQVRCPPLRGEYDDYGSVENIQEGLTAEAFFKGLDVDVLEKGVGNNTVHDVRVLKGMSRDEWLEALWEGRVFVDEEKQNAIREAKHQKLLAAIGRSEQAKLDSPIPTFQKVEELLALAGVDLAEKGFRKGVLVDELFPGLIRVRSAGYASDRSQLSDILPFLTDKYSAMVVAGTGSYPDSEEILVAPKPYTREIGSSWSVDHNFPGSKKDRAVCACMIREDVWQLMLSMSSGYHSRAGAATFEAMKEAALDYLAQWRELESKPEAEDDALRALEQMGLHHHEGFGRLIHWPSEGVSGYDLGQAMAFALSLDSTDEEKEKYVIDTAETVYILGVYSRLNGQLQPTTNAGQNTNFKLLREFRAELAKIKGKSEDDSDYEEYA